MKPYYVIPLTLAMAALAQQQAGNNRTAASYGDATLDRMIAAGKSPQDLARYLFDTHGCKQCHTMGHDGKLGYTQEGETRAQGFQGCIATLKAMSVIAKVPDEQRSATQRQRAERFQEFGCAACHQVSGGKMGLTEVGAKLAHLHLGCVDVEKLVAGKPGAPQP